MKKTKFCIFRSTARKKQEALKEDRKFKRGVVPSEGCLKSAGQCPITRFMFTRGESCPGPPDFSRGPDSVQIVDQDIGVRPIDLANDRLEFRRHTIEFIKQH